MFQKLFFRLVVRRVLFDSQMRKWRTTSEFFYNLSILTFFFIIIIISFSSKQFHL